jgi:hypothetical protein
MVVKVSYHVPPPASPLPNCKIAFLDILKGIITKVVLQVLMQRQVKIRTSAFFLELQMLFLS